MSFVARLFGVMMLTHSIASGSEAELAALVEQLRKGDWETQKAVVEKIKKLGSDAAPIVEPLCDLVQGKNARLRKRAQQAVVAIGILAIPALIGRLDRVGNVGLQKYYIGETLGCIGEPAIPALRAALKSQDKEIRFAAVHGCSYLGSKNIRGILEDLTECLNDRDARIAVHTLIALRVAGSDAKSAIPQLIEMLKVPELSRNAASTLASMDADAKAALPALQKVREDATGESYAIYAAAAIGRIDPTNKHVFDFLTDCLENEVDMMATFMAISAMGEHAKRFVPYMVDALSGGNAIVQRLTISCLGRLGATAADAVPVLTRLSVDGDDDTRIAAETALETISSELAKDKK